MFDFGKNWKRFSENALTNKGIKQAKNDFSSLFVGTELNGKRFLDIGFGQGLSLLIAKEMGASVVGCDIDEGCREVLEMNRKRYFSALKEDISVIIGSILHQNTIDKIKHTARDHDGCFEIVHSWGVLHHTGNMWKSVDIVSGLVSSKGYLILALYNRHWTSRFWWAVKWLYTVSPNWNKTFMIVLFLPIIYMAKYLVTLKNPLEQDRGMHFYYNVIDWIGGFPYEYASKTEVIGFVERIGFKCIRFRPSLVPTGCNEYIFVKK